MACFSGTPGDPVLTFHMTPDGGTQQPQGRLHITRDDGHLEGTRMEDQRSFAGKCDGANGIRFPITIDHVTFYLKGTVRQSGTNYVIDNGKYDVVAVGVALRQASAVEEAMSTPVLPLLPAPEVGDAGTWGGTTGT